MRGIALAVVLVQIVLMIYAVSTVRHKLLTDRRVMPDDKYSAVKASFVTAIGLLLVAGVMEFLSGERKFMSVREIWELGFIASAVCIGIAIRILKGDKRG